MQPNTLCKNRNCTKGENGGRSFYYSCKFCARTENWKSVACCIECLDEYTKQIEESRRKNKPISKLPERTDMNESQYNELMQTPIKQVKEETIKEITDAGYGEDLDEIGLTKTLEKINKDICESDAENITTDNLTETRRSRRSKYTQE